MAAITDVRRDLDKLQWTVTWTASVIIGLILTLSPGPTHRHDSSPVVDRVETRLVRRLPSRGVHLFAEHIEGDSSLMEGLQSWNEIWT
jgi:hypothetical protein